MEENLTKLSCFIDTKNNKLLKNIFIKLMKK